MEVNDVELMVLETLSRAISQNIEILKPAELKLKEWEIEPGYYLILLKIVRNYSIDLGVRWLAVTCFKNGVDRYWRKTAPNAIKEEEKLSLRNDLMETFREPNDIVASQLAVLISKAARYDFPQEWPQLIPNLLEISRNDDLLMQRRGLLVLYHVIKTLSSMLLPESKKRFRSYSEDIYREVLYLWNTNYEKFFSQVQNNDSNYPGTLERALLSIKTLYRLIAHGMNQFHPYPDIMSFISDIFDRCRKLLHFRKSKENESETLVKLAEKVILYLVKVLNCVLSEFPLLFISFIQPSLEFTVTFLFTEQGDGLLFEKFTVKCMNLLMSIISCPAYKSSSDDISKWPPILEVNRVKSEFFQEDILAIICRKLVTHYFLLTREDLELWDSNPESFEERANLYEPNAYGEFSLPSCTYLLFGVLFHEYKDSLSPVLLDLIQKNHHLVSPQDIDAILRKDAVYNAIGLAASDLYDEVDFDQWLSTTLLQELSVKDSNYRVIRRRIAWLFGQWACIKLSPEFRPTMYRALIPLLQGDEDLAVRLSAASALKRAIDDFQFSSDQFLEFLEPAFSLLFSLLKEVEECDTKLKILYILSFIAGRMGSAIKPYSQSLIRYLPLLWNESENHNMLRCAIVSTLARFVRGLINENFTSLLCPVIELCTNLNEDAHVYLLEEGLELWFAVVDNSSTLPPQLLQLYKAMPSVLEFSTEHLSTCVHIINSYILLSPQQFLSEYGESVISSCLNLLTELDDDGISLIMDIINTSLRANTSAAISICMPVLSKILLNLGSGEEMGQLVMSKFLEIICRVLLFSRDIFSQLLINVARDKSETAEQFLRKVLSAWLHFMPLLPDKERRKLLALALSSLLTIGSSTVLSHFRLIIKNIVEVLNDIYDLDGLTTQLDSMMVSEEFVLVSDDSEYPHETEGERRKRQLLKIDPVYNIELKSCFQLQINDLRNKLGTTNFEGLIRLLDQEIIEQCQLFISL